jgi:hypothetical protein
MQIAGREFGVPSADRAGGRASRWIVPASAMAVVGFAVFVGPRAYVGYHQWQLHRAGAHFAANVNDDAAFDRMYYHRDRLVDVGVYERVRHEFRHVPSDSPRAHKVLNLSMSATSPGRIDLISPAGKRGEPLVITITCTPSDVAAWQAFFSAQDVP